ILAYPCNWPLDQVGDTGFAPRINLFSSPDVSYLGMPIGTATENNAQALRDNMEVVSNFRGEDPCTPSPCGDNAVCAVSGGASECTCEDGYENTGTGDEFIC
ncbi:unnamed protein product, partial [Ectocarpus fasciculatus]